MRTAPDLTITYQSLLGFRHCLSVPGTVGLAFVVALMAGCSPNPSSQGSSSDGSATASSDIPEPGTASSDAELEDVLKGAQGGPTTDFEQRKSDYWANLGLPGAPPVIDAVRTVSRDEEDQVMRECMASKGFPSKVDEHGQVGIPFVTEQEEALDLSSYECFAMYPMEGKYFESFSIKQLRVLYDWNIGEVSTCLQGQGITPSPAPSFESFVERYAVTGVEYWTAYEGVDVGLVECEWEPPEEELYGD